MLRDYKVLKDRDIFSRRRSHKPLGLLLLGLLTLAASGIYGSLQIFGTDSQKVEREESANPLTASSPDNESGDRTTIPLAIPGLNHDGADAPPGPGSR